MAGENGSEEISVDRDALARIATELQKSAQAVAVAGAGLQKNDFGPQHAGANYSHQGDEVAEGLANILAWLTNWQTATNASAQQLGGDAMSYATTDAATTQALRSVGQGIPG